MELLMRVHRARNTTLVLVTHDAELSSLADTRHVLRDGRKVNRRGGGGAAMTFVVRMALREIRASWQRLLFFFICIRRRRGADRDHPLGHSERAAGALA